MDCRKRGMSPDEKGIDPGCSCTVLSVDNSLVGIMYKALRCLPGVSRKSAPGCSTIYLKY